jgi:hypothetical protein
MEPRNFPIPRERMGCQHFGRPGPGPLRPQGETFAAPRCGSIHSTCLSALVTDRVMEAWYHPLHE